MRRSGLVLVAAGILSAGFFALTDPLIGLHKPGADFLDVVRDALPGTVIGAAGSACVLLVGLWFLVRRAA